MKRSAVAWYLVAVAVGSGFVLATTIEANAKTYTIDCELVGGWPYLRNTTGRKIPRGARIVIRLCDEHGRCDTIAGEAASYLVPQPNYRFTDISPGEGFGLRSYQWLDKGLPYSPRVGATFSCTATVEIPEMFEERPKQQVKEYPPRTRAPGPPQPGLLEANPGYSPQSPSGMGTPTKPSTPPPSAPPAPVLR